MKVCTISLIVFFILVIIQVIIKSKSPVRSTIFNILTGILTFCLVNFSGIFTSVSLPLSYLSLGISGALGIPGVTLMLFLNLVI